MNLQQLQQPERTMKASGIKPCLPLHLCKLLLVCLLLINFKARAQSHPDSLHRPKLMLDSIKVAKAAAISKSYDAEIQKLVGDKSLTDADRQVKIHLLIAQKNQALRQLFAPPGIKNMASTDGPQRATDSGYYKKLEAMHLARKLGIAIDKAEQVNAVIEAFRKAVISVGTSSGMADKEKLAAINALAAQRNLQLGALLSPAQMALLEAVKRPVALRSSLQSKTITAIQDSFQLKINQVLNQKDLSQQDKNTQITQLLNARRTSIAHVQPTQTPAKPQP